MSDTKLSRRGFVLAGLAMCVAGCSEGLKISRPGPRPAYDPRTAGEDWLHPVTPPTPTHSAPAVVPADPMTTMPRSLWAKGNPIPALIQPMGEIDYITVHHEGWRTVTFTDQAATAARLELIRSIHVRDRGWADIGYHYIVDRAGRVWQGRPLAYQGAHVRYHNPHNIGVMALGNFDEQRPSDAQLASVQSLLQRLRQTHRVKHGNIYTHQELRPTACPGTNLQAYMNSVRGNGELG